MLLRTPRKVAGAGKEQNLVKLNRLLKEMEGCDSRLVLIYRTSTYMENVFSSYIH